MTDAFRPRRGTEATCGHTSLQPLPWGRSLAKPVWCNTDIRRAVESSTQPLRHHAHGTQWPPWCPRYSSRFTSTVLLVDRNCRCREVCGRLHPQYLDLRRGKFTTPVWSSRPRHIPQRPCLVWLQWYNDGYRRRQVYPDGTRRSFQPYLALCISFHRRSQHGSKYSRLVRIIWCAEAF